METLCTQCAKPSTEWGYPTTSALPIYLMAPNGLKEKHNRTNNAKLIKLYTGDGETFEKVCSYQDVLNHLNLTKANELFSMTRPVKDYRRPTEVFLEVLLYAILDVKEIDQTFVPYVWIFLVWQNEYIYWNSSDFCGIKNISLPTEILWKPDLTIEEMTEKDKAPPSPYLTINNMGKVFVQNDQVLVSTCRMQVHKFPFDVQSCTLSFKSAIHSIEEIRLVHHLNSSITTEWSRELMRTQYEWLFVDMTVINKTVSPFGAEQDTIIYTISMKRRSVLYIANFLLPVLFFLCLDLASFLISDRGGEKLSFKVTVLLAVTVMQLILNEILPSSSDKIPLIAVYCIGIFALMMLSLLETILVMHLMEKDSQDNESNADQTVEEQGRAINFRGSEREERKLTPYGCICGASAAKTPDERLQVGMTLQLESGKKGSISQPIEEPPAFEELSVELKEVVRILTLILQSSKEEEKPGYWTRKTKTINRVYFIFYVIAAFFFLVFMFSIWNEPQE
ncbi:5-hydroxytryptamine receptor 3A-like [Melanotaenia boesemani]|uniref:5-hydroxytryptamine receptor 3A-like n=1 Tax=Melanotaenia boesemani TaxID=1250792 RepID=UPI001C0427FF|nr:5-hydroxytryptamine receptor 3A-like [Melanotaenia boesemani]